MVSFLDKKSRRSASEAIWSFRIAPEDVAHPNCLVCLLSLFESSPHHRGLMYLPDGQASRRSCTSIVSSPPVLKLQGLQKVLRTQVGHHVNPAGGAGGSRTTDHAGLQATPLPLGYGASLLFSSVSLRPVEAFHLKMTSSASSTPCTSAPWINKCLPRTRSFSVPPSNFVANDTFIG